MAIKRKREQKLFPEPEPGRIPPEIAQWLTGLLWGLDRLTGVVQETLASYSLEAAHKLSIMQSTIDKCQGVIEKAAAAQPPRSDGP
jgi:hypothetical protein